MSSLREPRAGEKLSEPEAKAYVDHLYSTLYKYAHEKIYKGAFMTQLREGKLPLPVTAFFRSELRSLGAVLREDRRRADFAESAGPCFGVASDR